MIGEAIAAWLSMAALLWLMVGCAFVFGCVAGHKPTRRFATHLWAWLSAKVIR